MFAWFLEVLEFLLKKSLFIEKFPRDKLIWSTEKWRSKFEHFVYSTNSEEFAPTRQVL